MANPSPGHRVVQAALGLLCLSVLGLAACGEPNAAIVEQGRTAVPTPSAAPAPAPTTTPSASATPTTRPSAAPLFDPAAAVATVVELADGIGPREASSAA